MMYLPRFLFYLKNSNKSYWFIIILFVIVACGSDPQLPIASHLSQDIANQVMDDLLSNNIQVTQQLQKDGTYNILVHQSVQAEALSILSYHGGIPKSYSSLGTVFKKDSFISSPLEEQARLTYALQEEVASMLSNILGIVDVKVSITLPQVSQTFWEGNEVTAPSAAIYIRYRPDSYLSSKRNQLRLLISKAVPGLTPDNVALYMEEARKNN